MSRGSPKGDPGSLKRALRTRTRTLGSWLTFPCEATAEIMARAGFDWLVLDMEHAPLGVAEAVRLIRVIELAGLAALCRLPALDPALAKNMLDAGATGILVPHVTSAEMARQAVEAGYYPPTGTRGVGLARAQAYGYGNGLEDYRRRMRDSLVVIAMIESREGVEQVEAIAATPGLDGLLIGPYDLSASLGRIGQVDHPEVRAASRRVREAARRSGIACGIHLVHPSVEKARRAVRDGYTFLAMGVDMILLAEAAATAASFVSRTARIASRGAANAAAATGTQASMG